MANEPIRWARLEPQARDMSLAAGLEARIHDPLWLLGRQWQFGELNGDEDLGTAVAAELTAHIVPLSRMRPGPERVDTPFAPYDVSARPLETTIEAEAVDLGSTARSRVRAGQHFERLLVAHGAGRYAPAYRRTYALSGDRRPLDDEGVRFVRLLSGRAIDGARLYAALAASLRPTDGSTPSLPVAPAVAPADAPKVRQAAMDWLAWADGLVTAPPPHASAWVPERLEYAFAVDAPAADGLGITLEAEEYTDGTLDWHTFTSVPSPPGGPAPDVETVGPVTVVPTPVTYPGMPASRFWEFEDARVDFGNVQANPEDLGRMLLTEFALVYGGDWLLVPLDVPSGSIVRIATLDVRDTFGRVIRVRPTTALEPVTAGWRMFGISPRQDIDPVTGGPLAPGEALLAAPALAAGLQGRPIEDVLFLRDEMANMAWAVERSVEGEHGRPVDRASAAYAQRTERPTPSDAADVLSYRLRTEPPPHWLPLLPQRLAPENPSMTLRLGALTATQPDGSLVPIRPRGRVLTDHAPGVPMLVREEEVPREGARVTRAYQLARWMDGTTFLWLGRRKQVGRGEGSSGLQFDVVDER